jgi:hypothetical protein
VNFRQHRAHDHANMCASTKFWLTVLSELRARGVADACIVRWIG